MNYRDSCRQLQILGYLDDGEYPALPDCLPRYDDEHPAGVRFFRTIIEDEDFEHLSLQRTFFGRSQIQRVSFEGTDLFESNFCWNDFEEVNFGRAILQGCDLRCSDFTQVKFAHANLRGADLRRSSFTRCSFEGADLIGARIHESQRAALGLSAEQSAHVDWTSELGPEPGGG
jgi:uncharacterized protein YjbI with pentapeptide repeats